MTFAAELSNKQFQLNLVVQIGSEYYSKYQVDSGLVIDADKLGTVDKVRVNPLNVDIRSVKTTNNTANFDLLDKDAIISSRIGANADQFFNQEVKIYVGFITGSFDFADYKLISNVRVKTIKKRANAYSFTATEVTSLLQDEIFNTFNTLNGSINDLDTSLVLNDATNFPSSGKIKIGDEFISYSGKTTNTLTGLGRGDQSSTASSHSDGEQVSFVYETGAINPITLLLQMMISPGGGGTYDVLSDGLGIDQSLVDTSTFELIRDNNFTSDQFSFLLYDLGKAQTFFEEEILQATNTRFFPKDGKISLALLDQIDIAASVPVIDEDSTTTNPDWSINTDKLVNKVTIKYNYTYGTDTFSRIETFTDDESISIYGLKNPLVYEFKGITAGLSGSTIVSNRANRLLNRLSTPKAEIKVKTHFDQVERNIGDKIQLVNRYLPSTGGSLGFSEQLEILAKTVNFNDASAQFTLQFTSYNGLRLGLIAPSPDIVSVTDTSNFEVPDGSCYEVGYLIKINGETRTISAISGNIITVSLPFTSINIGDRVTFVDYDSASDLQKAQYAFVGFTGADFGDASKAYQILF